MNNLLLLRVSFAAARYKTFRHIIIGGFATAATGNLELEMSRSRRRKSDCESFNTLICQMYKEEEEAEALNRATQLLDQMRSSFNQMFSSVVTFNNDVLRGFLRIVEMNRGGDDCVNCNTLISDMSKAQKLSNAVQLLDHMRRVKGLTPSETTYTSLIHYLCKHDDRIDEANKVLNEMIVNGFSPSFDTANDVLRGFLRIGEIGKANQMRNKMDEHFNLKCWMDEDTYSLLLQGLSDEVTYTSLMHAYYDQGNCDHASKLLYEMTHLDQLLYGRPHCDLLPESVIYSVFINGLDNKVRTSETKKALFRANYTSDMWFHMPTLQYCRTLVEENCTYDEFKSLVELVEGFCITGLENAYDTVLKSKNYKPDGRIIYNLFIIEYCKRNNVDQAYNMYKEMVHYGFACHMFTLFALIQTLERKNMVNKLHWVIQNVLRGCNLNDYEILKFLNEFNFDPLNQEALFDLLAEKANDGLFLKCSYAPATAASA